jgi:hypothetical protein
MSRLEFPGIRSALPTGEALIDVPDAWPLYPILPLHRDHAETAVVIGAPGFPAAALVLINMCDPRLPRMLAHRQVHEAPTSSPTRSERTSSRTAGRWANSRAGGSSTCATGTAERSRVLSAKGRGYKGLSSLPVPCARCEASGTVLS